MGGRLRHVARVLITSSRNPGFVLPLMQIATALVGRGDTVFVLTGRAFAPQVAAAGATLLLLPYDDDAPVRPLRRQGGLRELGRSLRGIFLDLVAVDHEAVLHHIDALHIDIVITEPLFLGASMLGLLPRDSRPAVLSIGLFPLPLSSPDTAPYGMGMAPLGTPLNRVRNSLVTVSSDLKLGRINREFRDEVQRITGVRPRGRLLDLAFVSDAYAQMSVPQLEYPRRSMNSDVRFVGPLPPPPVGGLPDWWDYSDPRPVVHVTQGTYANEDLTQLVVPTIRALADAPVLVVATTGGPDPSIVQDALGGRLPDNARVARFLPYHHLLAAAAVVVTNGGFGTVHHALRWGVPMVVSGTSEDKLEVNARVAWAGVGVDLRAQRPTPERIGDAVLRVLGDVAMRRAAIRIGALIAGTDALRDVLGMVDVLVGTTPQPHPDTVG